MKQIISKDKLLESGLQYGHKTESWNPAMKPFIATVKRDIHMINLDKTAMSLDNAYNVVKKKKKKRGTFLFVGTTKQSSKTVRENAERVGAFYIDHRWLGGILTNFRTIQNSINKLRRLERLEKDNFEGYTKKEAILMKKKLDKLEKTLGGIKFMRRVPNAIFVTSIRNEDIAIKEAKKMKIPVFGIADTNVDPYDVNFPIFGNDDANKSTSLVTTIIADAIASAKNEGQLAAYVNDEEVKIMGLDPKKEYTPRDDKYKRKTFTPKPSNNNELVFEKVKATLIVDGLNDEDKKDNEIIIEKHSSTIDNTDNHIKQQVNATQKEIDELKLAIDEEAKKTLAEITNAKKTRQEQMRKELLNKLMENNDDVDFQGIKLTDIYGIGKKCEEYLIANDYKTIEDVANMDVEKVPKEFISNLPNLTSATFEDNKEKLLNISNEAKLVLKKHKERVEKLKADSDKIKKTISEKELLEKENKILIEKINEEKAKLKKEAEEKKLQAKKQADALEEAKRIHEEKELQKKEQARLDILKKLSSNEDLSDVDIINIYGVGPKLGEYLVNNNLTTVGEVAKLNIDNIPEDIIKNLPNLKSATFEDNKEKIVNIIKEAKVVIALNKINEKETEAIHTFKKEGGTQGQMRDKLLTKLSKNHKIADVELVEIYGIGEKVGEYFVNNNIITIEDVSKLKVNELTEKFIKEFPNLTTSSIEDNKEKLSIIIKEAKYIFKKHKEIELMNNKISTQESLVIASSEEARRQKELHEKNEKDSLEKLKKDKKQVEEISKKTIDLEELKKQAQLKEKEKRDKLREDLLSRLSENDDILDIEVIKIYGVGTKIGEYLIKHNLTTVGEVSKLNVSDIPDDIVKNLPSLKSSTLEDNREKIINIIKEAKFLINKFKENNK